MRNQTMFGVVIILAVISTGLLIAQPDEELQICSLPSHQEEAFNENLFMLVKTLSFIHSERTPLENPRTLGLYHSLMISMRGYHEDQRGQIPECAQGLNEAYVQTITATQDVLGLMMAEKLNPNVKRYQSRLEAAKMDLNEQWKSFSVSMGE